MFYIKKNKVKPVLTEKTLAEKLTGRFDMKETPSVWQLKRFYMALVAGILILGCHMACEAVEAFSEVIADNGAGNTWTCGNCGESNYCWQMSCGNCGKGQ